MKTIPGAMVIEEAIEEISNDPNEARDRAACAKELEEASGKAGYPMSETPEESFQDGYYLGLRVAKVLQGQGAKL